MHNILDNLDYVSQYLEVALHRLLSDPSQDDIDEAETAMLIARTYLNKAKNNACDMGYRLGEGEPSSAPRYSKLKEIRPKD
jgi:hypothetical protein